MLKLPEWELNEINIRRRLTRFTLEFSFSISKAGAAHHLAILPLPVPFLPDLVVYTIIVAPLWRRQRNKRSRSYPLQCSDIAGGEQLGVVSGTKREAGERIFPAHVSPTEEMGSCWKWVQLLQLLTAEDCYSSRKWLKALGKRVSRMWQRVGRGRGREMKENLIDMGQEGREKYFKCSFLSKYPVKLYHRDWKTQWVSHVYQIWNININPVEQVSSLQSLLWVYANCRNTLFAQLNPQFKSTI